MPEDPDLEIEEEAPVTPEIEAVNYLIWRRIQLSKAKLKGVTEMAALMAGFSVVRQNFIGNYGNSETKIGIFMARWLPWSWMFLNAKVSCCLWASQ